ncbi:MAG: hypothetical protein ACAH35_02220 [Candidatus Paceibacterota bacterium]
MSELVEVTVEGLGGLYVQDRPWNSKRIVSRRSAKDSVNICVSASAQGVSAAGRILLMHYSVLAAALSLRFADPLLLFGNVDMDPVEESSYGETTPRIAVITAGYDPEPGYEVIKTWDKDGRCAALARALKDLLTLHSRLIIYMLVSTEDCRRVDLRFALPEDDELELSDFMPFFAATLASFWQEEAERMALR